MHERRSLVRTLLQQRLVRIRNAAWEHVPHYGSLEIEWRTRRALRRHWDLAFIASLPASRAGAVDVGANVGMYARVLARSFGSVHAFEPNPRLVRRLRRVTSDRVIVHPTGLSDRPGCARLRVPISGGLPRHGYGSLHSPFTGVEVEETSIRLQRLDDLALRDIAFIKIDVEGHEANVLAGAEGLVRHSQPRILVECEERHRPGAVAAVAQRLERCGYVGYFPWMGQVLPVHAFEPSTHQPAELADEMSPHYAHMFLFAPSPDEAAEREVADAWRQVAP